jgi:hypothetical protein
MFIFGLIDEVTMMAVAFAAGVNPTSRAMITGVASNAWKGMKSAVAYVTGRYNPRGRG